MDSKEMTVYRECKPVVDAKYEPESDHSPASTIVIALSKASGVDPLELPPLYGFIDPDSLENLFSKSPGSNGTVALLSFRIRTWIVFACADGRIRICDTTQPTDVEPVFESTLT